MNDDLIVKTLTGLMLEQKQMTEGQRTLAGSHHALAKAMEELSRVVRVNSQTLDTLTEASERQEFRFGELLTEMTDFTATSSDTRKRLLALEQEVEKLKNAS